MTVVSMPTVIYLYRKPDIYRRYQHGQEEPDPFGDFLFLSAM